MLPGHHRAQQEHPDQHEHRRRHQPRQQVFEEARRRLSREGNVALGQHVGDLRIDANRGEMLRGVLLDRRLVRAGDLRRSDHQVGDAVLFDQALEFAVRDDLDVTLADKQVPDQQNGEEDRNKVQDVELEDPLGGRFIVILHRPHSRTSLARTGQCGWYHQPGTASFDASVSVRADGGSLLKANPGPARP